MKDFVIVVKKIEDEYRFVMECKTNCYFRETFLNKYKGAES